MRRPFFQKRGPCSDVYSVHKIGDTYVLQPEFTEYGEGDEPTGRIKDLVDLYNNSGSWFTNDKWPERVQRIGGMNVMATYALKTNPC